MSQNQDSAQVEFGDVAKESIEESVEREAEITEPGALAEDLAVTADAMTDEIDDEADVINSITAATGR